MPKQTESNASLRQANQSRLERLLPCIEWLASYQSAHLTRDLLAGFCVALLLIPQAMAYAQLANLPPQVGLYASVAPALVYVLLGTSRYVSLGPVALVSLLVGEAVVRTTVDTGSSPVEAASVLAVIVGVTLTLLGALRFGFLVNFISDPVLLGFTSAAAILIAVTQLDNLVGLDIPREAGVDAIVLQITSRFDEINPCSTAIGVGTLLILLVTGKPLEHLLAKLAVREKWRIILTKGMSLPLLAVSTWAVWYFELQQKGGVAVVGAINESFLPLRLPLFDAALWWSLLPSGLAISVIVFVTGIAVAKSLAGRRRQQIDPEQEAIALGAAQLAVACTGGYPVGASVSRSAVNFTAGAGSPVSSVIGALWVLVVLGFMGFLLHSLPKAFLAALIIVSVFSLFDLRAWLEVWRYSLLEGISLLITFLGALWLGVEWGIAVGALAGVALYLWRTSRPRIVIEGRMGNSTAFRSLDRKEVEPEPSPVLVVRIDQDLYFANSGYCENQILKAVAEHQTLRVLVLDLKAVTEIDVSGSGMLKRLIRNLADAGISVSIAGATLPVTKALKNDGVSEIIGKEQFFVTVNEAVSDLSASLEPEKSR